MRLTREPVAAPVPVAEPPGPVRSYGLVALVAVRGELLRYGVAAMLRELAPLVGEVVEDGRLDGRHVDVVVLSPGADTAALADRAARRRIRVLGLVDETAGDVLDAYVDGVVPYRDLTLETLRDALTGTPHTRPATRADRPRRALTPRERQVLGLVAQGLSNKQIARRLAVSEHGVKKHVASLLTKLDCPNRTIAAVRALNDGLLT
ncbi:DNA-binding response regulator, NarL/FixJ family, contains REC and HTH domains [Thermomonospora echinospora]|uniref:DNA-binding response regulator, NarL/FixJ family, contains REC and HTH domains n=1 Tax=Thermomonospora echinospora TaxID=1992 RepID=A0A1H5VHR9_9ACTN|nr:response regulator transcription factor [Thermomonospora echinospora]SEF86341.1 DNA-binding response regulator, NarL/FixJ family, contains REC and HTH domains [Thermomonospora echinospora]